MFNKILIVAISVLLVGSYYAYKSYIPTSKSVVEHSGTPATSEEISSNVEVVLANLDIPWDMAFLPDKTLFITERKGIVWQLDGTNKKKILELSDVAHVGEGGLLGVAHHPNHAKNGYTYLYYTYKQSLLSDNDQNGLKNKVVRYSHVGDSLQQNKVILENIPGSMYHNGGRMAFGPDGKLYITTGDSQDPSTSQSLDSVAGKILRLNDDGSKPSDNPFSNSFVYSYGHRNPQGLAWDSSGRLWATEHGQSAQDEVNIIFPGKNYGWPEARGEEKSEKFEEPFLHSGNNTWAPSGTLVSKDKLFFTGLRGGAIFSVDLKTKNVKEYFKNQFGRIRTIVDGPDGNFYVLTSNRDGRGRPVAEDDRLIRIPANLLQ